jgi:hypothetical protein
MSGFTGAGGGGVGVGAGVGVEVPDFWQAVSDRQMQIDSRVLVYLMFFSDK